MANCVNCGGTVGKGVKFCPSCGTAVKGGTAAKGGAAARTAKPKAKRSEDQTKEIQVSPADAERNRGMAVVCYLVFFIPLVISEHKKSEYVKFHANQGTVLFLFGIGGWIALSLIFALLSGIFIRTYSFGMLGFIAFLWPLYGIGILVLEIIGIVNSLKCRTNRLPLIGRIEIIK